MYDFFGFDRGFKEYLSSINMGDFAARYADKEKIREWKKRFIKKAEKKFMPVRINVSPIYKTPQFWRGSSRYVVNVNPEFVSAFDSKEDITKIVNCLSMIPTQSHEIHWRMINAYIYGDSGYLTNPIKTGYEKAVPDYFEGRITYDEVMSYFADTTTWGTPNVGGDSRNNYSGGKKVGRYDPLSDLSLYKEALKKISKNFVKQARTLLEPSMKSGNRINRGYVTGTSYKPLLKKSLETHSKAKVMILNDCSGSMGYGDYTHDPAHKGVSFIGALANSGVVDVTHIVYHSSDGFEDVTSKIKSGDLFQYVGGSEGFEYVDDNLPTEWIKEVDFIIVITDLNYSESAQEGLYNYVSRAPHHMILSFDNEGDVKGLNVRKVSTIKDMLNAVSSITK